MYEVRISRPFKEGGLALNAVGALAGFGAAAELVDDENNPQVNHWFKEELDWCKERDIAVTTKLIYGETDWICPDRNQIHEIKHNGLAWDGPPVQFVFKDESAALLFKLVWV